MLDVAAQHKFHFDSCQMPLNVMDAHFRSFAHQVVPRLVKEGIAVLGMKPMGSGNVLKSGVVTPIECLHYALSLPTSVVINGCDSMERLDQAFEAARTFKPMSAGGDFEAAGEDRAAGHDGPVRAVQDHRAIRRDGKPSGMDGMKDLVCWETTLGGSGVRSLSSSGPMRVSPDHPKSANGGRLTPANRKGARH